MRVLLFLMMAGCAASAEPGATPEWLRDAGAPVVEVDPFTWDARGQAIAAGSEGTITLRLVVPPDHFVYADRVSVEVVDAAGLEVGPLALPPGDRRPDPAGELGEREAYPVDTFMDLPIRVPADAPAGARTVVLDIRHQGCRVGLCFPPKTTRVEVLVPVRAPRAAPPG